MASNSHQYSMLTFIPFVSSDGFLVRMFGQQDAAFFIESLLRMNVRDVYLVKNVPGWSNALMVQRPSVFIARCDALVDNVPFWILDFIPLPTYQVVPQTIRTPPNQSDWRQYVEQAYLRMPVFFLQNNGAIGLPLPRAVVGDTASLHGANTAAPLGGDHSTLIHIAWPGYESWVRQIQIRGQTQSYLGITLGSFAKIVADIVDGFLTSAATNVGRDPNWTVSPGPGGITRNHVVIVGTVQVFAGSWMPILQISHPLSAPTTHAYVPA